MRKDVKNATAAAIPSADPILPTTNDKRLKTNIMSSQLKIYTRTGDKGLTSLYGGKRVAKDDARVVAYGTVDELNSTLGILLSQKNISKKISTFLTIIQSDLFTIGAHLAGKNISLNKLTKRVKDMENLIDTLSVSLPPLKNFILPGGSELSSLGHFTRSVCRRAEREVVKLIKKDKIIDKQVIIYLNRLSDLMFIIARYLNHKKAVKEVIWQPNN